MKTKLYIVRHTETIGNIEKRLTGREDYEVTENGEKAIEKLTKKLSTIKIKQKTNKTQSICEDPCGLQESASPTEL